MNPARPLVLYMAAKFVAYVASRGIALSGAIDIRFLVHGGGFPSGRIFC